jgi:hypothetical protein
MGRSIDIKPHQNDRDSHPGLELQLCEAKHSSPNVQQEFLSIVAIGEFVSVISPGWNRDRRRRADEVLRHLRELVGFGLSQHRSPENPSELLKA